MILVGTVKQMAWANDIKNSKMDLIKEIKEEYSEEEAAHKAVVFVQNIRYSEFWIDFKDYRMENILELLITTGLEYKGRSHGDRVKMDEFGTFVFFEDIF